MPRDVTSLITLPLVSRAIKHPGFAAGLSAPTRFHTPTTLSRVRRREKQCGVHPSSPANNFQLCRASCLPKR